MLKNFTLLTRAIDLPYNGKSSLGFFRVTTSGEIIKIAIRGSLLLTLSGNIQDINSEVIRQIDESEECPPEEVQLVLELAREQMLTGAMFNDENIAYTGSLEIPHDVPLVSKQHTHSFVHTFTTFAHNLMHTFNPLHQR